LGEMGARVALVARKRDELDEAVARLGGQGIESVAVVCDMSVTAAIAPMVEEAVAALGPIDVLVNNAGATLGATTLDHPLECAQYKSNANAIAPRYIPTRMTKSSMEMMGDAVTERAPMKRVGGPEDLKGVTVLFASDACAFITGQVIAVDGGVTAI